MDMRAEVWSPVQNIAVWCGAWLWGHESTDDLLDALTELGGEHVGGELYSGTPFTDVLALIRRETAEIVERGEREPAMRLILSGPGEAPALPAGSASARAATENPAGAIVVRTNDRDRHLVLVPTYDDAAALTRWDVIEETEPLPQPAWLSPGEADALLSQATNESAALIEASGERSDALPNPRLTVGTLSDFYDTPGLPSAVPGRSAKLFARADRVAAIIETVTDRINDHSFDPQLLRLWRHIRQARMAGVAYALSDFSR